MAPKILFICTGNSCRSQMAEGIAKSMGVDAFSAGVEPAKEVNPHAISVMTEIGIDISNLMPENVSKYMPNSFKETFDLVITLCDHAESSCPSFSGNAKKIIHQPFEDPYHAKGTEGEILNVYRDVRDQIEKWCKENLK